MPTLLTLAAAALTYRLCQVAQPHVDNLRWLHDNREEIEMSVLSSRIRRHTRLFSELWEARERR